MSLKVSWKEDNVNMMNLEKARIKYNKLLKRERNAELYLNNKNIDLKIITEKYIPAYQKIIRELSILEIVLRSGDKK